MAVGPDRTEDARRAALWVATAIWRQATAVASAAEMELPEAAELERSIGELRERQQAS